MNERKTWRRSGSHSTGLLTSVTAIALVGSLCTAHAQQAPSTAPTTSSQAGAPIPVPPVAVTAPPGSASTPATGTVANGYRVDTVTELGPFSNLSLQDTPYSLNVLSGDFIENTGGYMSVGNDVLNKSPFFDDTYTDERGLLSSGATRGLSNGNGFDYFLTDGLPAAGNASNEGLEEYDRVEILSGADTGFLYGVSGNVGGVNFVLKRPTPRPYYSATAGYDDGSAYGNVDVGNTISDGKFGYRFVLVGDIGDSASTPDQSTQRSMLYGAFDIRPVDSLLVQLDVLHTNYLVDSPPPIWTDHLAPVNPFVDVPNPSKSYVPPWTFIHTLANQVGIKPTWNATDWLAVRGAFRYAEDTYDNVNTSNWLTAPDTYTSWSTYGGETRYTDFAGYTYVDAKFDIGSLKSKLTFGVEESELSNYDQTPSGFAGTPFETKLNFSQQPQTPYVNLPSELTGPGYLYARTEYRNSAIGDRIDAGSYFSVLAGVNYAQIDARSLNAQGIETNNYDVSKFTPTVALMFRPSREITTYLSYAQSLQEGEIVNDPLATNNGAVLPPYPEDQYELGVKATAGNTLYTFDVFDIRQANLYTVDNPNGTDTYVESGLTISKGVEFSATGEIHEGLRVLGGFMLADARVSKDQADPAMDGNVPANAARELIKATLEYDIPFVAGLTATGGAYYTGPGYPYSPNNTVLIPGHTTFDLGLRYGTRMYGLDWMFRAYAENVTNSAYWLLNSTLADGRRVMATAQAKW